jgi:tRNA-2-methylthio-N6-dimethylallyladenosine synthase
MVFGTQNIHELPQLVRRAFSGEDRIVAVDRQKPRSTFDYFSDVSPRRESDIVAWVPIIEGCDYFCTYCVVPYTRGRQLSRPPESILREVLELAAYGFKEVTLLGQTVDSYGKDFTDRQYNLADLLYELNEINGLERIRFMTSHPLDLNDTIIDAVATLPKVMEYIHIPMQAGDDEVLARMKRGYTAAQYYELVDKIHARIPGVAVSGDYIVGFPGETEAQFQRTLESVSRSGIYHANTATYSPRKQTPAAILEQRGEEVPAEVKEDRLQRLNEAIRQQAERSNAPYLGQTVEVLVEGRSKRNETRLTGRTRNNKVVNFDSRFTEDELVGQLVQVRIVETFPWSLLGEHQTVCPAEEAPAQPVSVGICG